MVFLSLWPLNSKEWELMLDLSACFNKHHSRHLDSCHAYQYTEEYQQTEERQDRFIYRVWGWRILMYLKVSEFSTIPSI